MPVVFSTLLLGDKSEKRKAVRQFAELIACAAAGSRRGRASQNRAGHRPAPTPNPLLSNEIIKLCYQQLRDDDDDVHPNTVIVKLLHPSIYTDYIRFRRVA